RQHHRLGTVRALHPTLASILLPLDLDLPARGVPVADACQLPDGALVGEPAHLVGLEALPEPPIQLGFEIRVPLAIGGPLAHVHGPHRETEVLQVLREVEPIPAASTFTTSRRWRYGASAATTAPRGSWSAHAC